MVNQVDYLKVDLVAFFFYARWNMRKLVLFISLLAALPCFSRERTLGEIREAAAVVLKTNTNRAQSSNSSLQVVLKKNMLTVLSNSKQFAVIANDDAFPAVVGYSDVEFSEYNSNLVWFINAADESMRLAKSMPSMHRAQVLPDLTRFKSNIDPLLKTTWNQYAPYNNLCPTHSNGENYPTGCVATAISQIMKYHSYPTNGIGSHQYAFVPASGDGRIISADFGATTYGWSKMLDNYVEGNYTEEEANEVATVMLHCGVSVDMQYTPTGSGAYSSEARSGLIKYFGYNENIGIVFREYYSLEQWMDMVYAELNNNRPIYYAGSDASQGGHAFVIDGYNATGLVHVNWGWGPKGGNGYFDITLLNPKAYQFSEDQNMLLGIDLPTTEVEYESHIVSDYPLSVSQIGKMLNVSIGQYIWNLCGDVWEGELAVVLEGEGKTYLLSQGTVSKTIDRKNVLSNTNPTVGGVLTLPTGIADGEYRLYVGAKCSREKCWRLVRRSEEQVNSYQVTIADGAVKDVVADTDDTWESTTTAIKAVITKGTNAPSRYFDLQGREVNGSTKGLIIRRQGDEVKKVLVK